MPSQTFHGPFHTGREDFEKQLKAALKGKDGYFKPFPNYRGRKNITIKVPSDTCLCHGVEKKRLVVETEFGFYVEHCDCHSSKSRKRRSRARHRVSSSYSRYREQNPNFERFKDMPAGAKLGRFKRFSSNSVVENTVLLTTGSHVGSIKSKRTWDSLNPGPPYRSVGPFASIETKVSGADPTGSGYYRNEFSPGSWWEYNGFFVDDGDWFSDSVGNYTTTTVPVLSGYDTAAWDKLKPRVAQANLGQFLYELKDLPGQLETSANAFYNEYKALGGSRSTLFMHPKLVAENFLNHVFGWEPFLGDLYNLYDTYNRSNEFISDLVKRNGTWQRKRRDLDTNVTQTHLGRRYSAGVEPFGFQIQGLCSDMVVDGITCKAYFDLTQVVETKVWAVGQFSFYRPEFDVNDPAFGGIVQTVNRLTTLYGLRVNPTLVYKLTPWSWTVDWFTGLGKHIQRLDDFITDGIVSRNLCIMRTTRRFVTKTCVINFTGGRRALTFRREVSTKCRKVADSPYGFDVTWNNLSVRQLAILGAIGITRDHSGFISRGA